MPCCAMLCYVSLVADAVEAISAARLSATRALMLGAGDVLVMDNFRWVAGLYQSCAAVKICVLDMHGLLSCMHALTPGCVFAVCIVWATTRRSVCMSKAVLSCCQG